MTNYPNFLILGAQKAGTSSIHAVLRQHIDGVSAGEDLDIGTVLSDSPTSSDVEGEFSNGNNAVIVLDSSDDNHAQIYLDTNDNQTLDQDTDMEIHLTGIQNIDASGVNFNDFINVV